MLVTIKMMTYLQFSQRNLFPLPLVNQNVAAMPQDQVVLVNDNTNGIITEVDDVSRVIYAPISMFEFNSIFTNEAYFIKLCQICDKANVPHHFFDDVVDLLRDCKKNNINIQPEQLRKRVHF